MSSSETTTKSATAIIELKGKTVSLLVFVSKLRLFV